MFINSVPLLFLVLQLTILCSSLSPNITLLSTLEVEHAAVPKIIDFGGFPGTNDRVVLISTFDGMGDDYIYYVDVPSKGHDPFSNLSKELLSNKTAWPNYMGSVPESAFGPNTIAAAGGFIPKPTGTIDIYTFPSNDPQLAKRTKVSTDNKGWFYHAMVWIDVNQDGHLDILTARTYFSTFGKKYGQVLWLQNPGSLTEGWDENLITSANAKSNGIDTNFIMETMTDGRSVLIGSEFFSTKALVMLICDQPLWSQCSSADLTRVVIDQPKGPFFCSELVDLNNDGIKELLVSSNRADGKGAILVYEVPANYKAGNWPSRTLATGWVPYNKWMPGKGSPGLSQTFYPTRDESKKPWIGVSTDDAGDFLILTPTSEAPDNWNYTTNQIYHTKGTLGSFDVSDLDGDGFNEVVVADYNKGKLLFYTFGGSRS